MVELVFGARRPARASSTRRSPPPALDAGAARRRSPRSLGAEHVLTDDETRRLRTRGKSTPDLLRARGRRPDRRARRRRPPGHATTRSPPSSPFAVEHHLAVVPFGGGTSVTGGLVARREGFAGVLSLDLVRMKRLVAVDHVSMTATLEPGLRGPEAEALLAARGPDPRPLPAVLRVRHHRRLRRHPVQRPVQRRLRPLRRARRRPHRRDPARPARPRQRPGQRRRPRPAPAVPRLRGHLRRDHLGHRPGAPAARGQGLRGLALAVLRRRCRRDAHPRAGRACCRP